MVKEFNTTFAPTPSSGQVAGQQLDVLIAGDDDAGVEAVADFATAGGLTPFVAGPLRRAQQLEEAGLLNIVLSASEHLPQTRHTRRQITRPAGTRLSRYAREAPAANCGRHTWPTRQKPCSSRFDRLCFRQRVLTTAVGAVGSFSEACHGRVGNGRF
jgi:hypothetical protein